MYLSLPFNILSVTIEFHLRKCCMVPTQISNWNKFHSEKVIPRGNRTLDQEQARSNALPSKLPRIWSQGDEWVIDELSLMIRLPFWDNIGLQNDFFAINYFNQWVIVLIHILSEVWWEKYKRIRATKQLINHSSYRRVTRVLWDFSPWT